MDLVTPLGEQMRMLYEIFQVNHKYFVSDYGDPLHIEFFPGGFDITSEEQANLLASICYHIKRGIWRNSIDALNKLVPGQELDIDLNNIIKDYFSGEQYDPDDNREEHFQTERNPFILEVLAYIMLYNLEHTPNIDLTLRAMDKIHLSSKIPGLDVAALACTPELEYYIIIGEAKNRMVPSQGTIEAFEAFGRHNRGESSADIRQVMSLLSESAKLLDIDGNELCEKLSKDTIWKEKYIYRLTIEHQTKKPHGGSQFKDFSIHVDNIAEPDRKQCEAFGTQRLTSFHNKVSQIIVDYIVGIGVEVSA